MLKHVFMLLSCANPLNAGVRLCRAMMVQMQLQQQALHVQHVQLTGLADAVMAAGNTLSVELDS